jgi:hypothetical protein
VNTCKPKISAEEGLRHKSHQAKKSSVDDGHEMLGGNDLEDLAETSKRHG